MTHPAAGSRWRRETGATPRRRRGAVATMSLFVVTALALLVGPFAAADDSTTTFVVRRQGTGEVLAEREIAVGATVRLEHVHSVTRRPVVETFSVLDGATLGQETMFFDAFGANLPTGPETIDGRTTTFEEVDGGYLVGHGSRPLDSVPLLVGSPDVDHTLVFDDGEHLHLLDIAGRWEQVEFAVTARSRMGGSDE